MSNDKPKKRSWWSGTQRDLEAERRLKSHRASSRSELDVSDPFSEVPTPVQSVEQVPDVDTGMTERIAEDEDLNRLFVRSEHNRKLIGEARKDAANLVISALGKVPPSEQMSKLERMIRRIRWIVLAVAIPAGSSAILVGKYIYNRAVENTRQSALIERMIDRENEHTRKIDQLQEEVRSALELARQNAKRIDDLRGR